MIIKIVDSLLKPIGFTRKKNCWNRKVDGLIEVIETQVSKSTDMLTISAGVVDNQVYKILWGNEVPEFVLEPSCTVRARIGELIDGKELWWQLSDSQIENKILAAINDYLFPFLERMHHRKNMIRWLESTNVVKKKYPPPILNLAILHELLDESSEAITLLAEVEKKAKGEWSASAIGVSNRLGLNRNNFN